MRTRLLASEAALADYEILEMLLFLGIPRRDTKPQAKALINRFGSLAAALTAERDDLKRSGLPPLVIKALDLVESAAEHLARPEQRERVVLDTRDALRHHLDLPSRSQQPPGFSVLLLNNRNQLVCEHRWPAGIDPATLAREMLRHALDRHATAAILVRDRGSATPEITPDDRRLHDRLQRAAAALSVVVHDFVVTGGGEWASLRYQDPR